MKKKFILILLIDNKSINEEIILKSFNELKKSKNNYIIIGSKILFKKLKKKIHFTNFLNEKNLKKKIIFYNIETKNLSNFKCINKLTDTCIDLLNKGIGSVLINMPITKKKYFNNKYLGFTEFFSEKLGQSGSENMLLYNEKFSVLPLTTHVTLSKVPKLINSIKISNAINNIINFYKNFIRKKVEIKILGLNPHAGTDLISANEEVRIINPAIKKLKKKIKNIDGPVSSDSAFMTDISLQKKCFVGMYHDQVLPVFKTLFGFEGANITIGLKYLRLSPDHGTGLKLIGKSKKFINNKSFLYCLRFCEKYIKS